MARYKQKSTGHKDLSNRESKDLKIKVLREKIAKERSGLVEKRDW